MIKEAVPQLENSIDPIVTELHQEGQFKVMTIAFKAGTLWPKTQINLPSKMIILSGSLIYKHDDLETITSQYCELDIPVCSSHAIQVLSDSLCLLTQSLN